MEICISLGEILHKVKFQMDVRVFLKLKCLRLFKASQTSDIWGEGIVVLVFKCSNCVGIKGSQKWLSKVQEVL